MFKVIAMGYVVALMAVTAAHANPYGAKTIIDNKWQSQPKGGVYQPTGWATPFSCGTKTCTCNGASDCFNMGALNVCKDKIVDVKGQPGKGTCTAK